MLGSQAGGCGGCSTRLQPSFQSTHFGVTVHVVRSSDASTTLSVLQAVLCNSGTKHVGDVVSRSKDTVMAEESGSGVARRAGRQEGMSVRKDDDDCERVCE